MTNVALDGASLLFKQMEEKRRPSIANLQSCRHTFSASCVEEGEIGRPVDLLELPVAVGWVWAWERRE